MRKAIRTAAPQITVWCVGDAGAPPLGTQDPEILIWSEAYDFVLVTDNRRSMPAYLTAHLTAGRHVPGIFVLRPDLSMGETIDELIFLCDASLPNEYQDQIRYLPISW